MTHFLLLDESVSDKSFALTGVSVPLNDCARLRDTYYHSLKPFLIEPESGPAYASPLELKGRSLLPSLDDDQEIEAVRRVVDPIVAHGLGIYRVGSLAKARFQRTFSRSQADMISVCWAYMTHAISDLLRQGLVVPVMDLGPDIQNSRMARFVASMNAARQTDLRDSATVAHNENLGEILFADSASSCA